MSFYLLRRALKSNNDDKSLVGFLTDLALVADIDKLDEDDQPKDSVDR